MTNPTASVIVITRNEARFIGRCIESVLAQQGAEDAELLLVDAASTDGTITEARRVAGDDPRVRIIACHRVLTFGEARNLGVRAARSDLILFLSGDAEAKDGWLARAREGLESFDIVYGHQEHAPPVWTVGAVSRGLRYHVFDDATTRPAQVHASNVNAAYRRTLLRSIPFQESTSALEDVLVAEEAERIGYRLAYDPRLCVVHRDVADLRAERRKVRREGLESGRHRAQLGWDGLRLAWGVGIVVGMAGLLLFPSDLTLILLAVIAYAPAAWRIVRRNARYPLALLGAATAIAPAFDAIFLVSYLQGLLMSIRPAELVTGTVAPNMTADGRSSASSRRER
ncbi:MAG: glycosyltransferase family 2 protein [Thermoplasmatota archaeon]